MLREIINPHALLYPRERAVYISFARTVEYRMSITRSFVNSRPRSPVVSVEPYRHNVAGDSIRRILISPSSSCAIMVAPLVCFGIS